MSKEGANLTIARMTLDPDPTVQVIKKWPKNGTLLNINVHDGQITLWVLAEQECTEFEERTFLVMDWGKRIKPEELLGARFLATCTLGVTARHIFSKKEKKQSHRPVDDDQK